MGIDCWLKTGHYWVNNSSRKIRTESGNEKGNRIEITYLWMHFYIIIIICIIMYPIIRQFYKFLTTFNILLTPATILFIILYLLSDKGDVPIWQKRFKTAYFYLARSAFLPQKIITTKWILPQKIVTTK